LAGGRLCYVWSLCIYWSYICVVYMVCCRDSSVGRALSLELKGPDSDPVRVISALHPSWSIKWVAQCAEVSKESLLRTNPSNRAVCSLQLYFLAYGYRKGMSSSILWLPALHSVNPSPYIRSGLCWSAVIVHQIAVKSVTNSLSRSDSCTNILCHHDIM